MTKNIFISKTKRRKRWFRLIFNEGFFENYARTPKIKKRKL
jgi:hypothetical protein